ncbi:MAG TPA: Smr/MutS family protein [Polyangiaceae bacterium]
MTAKKKPDPKSPFAALRSVKEELAKKDAEKAAGKKPVPAKGKIAKPIKVDAEEERLSFHRMMSGVQPLEAKKGRVPVSAQVPPSGELVPRARAEQAKAAIATEEDAVHEHLRALVEGKERFEVQDDGRRVEGRRLDLPADVLRKLRRGLVPIDARLDLHGLGASDARGAVEGFLRSKRAAGERCVLVVTGKGDHSPRGQPVLRGEIAAWLSQGPASEHVAAFVTAARDDGGEGAVYVLLRR